MSRTLTDKATLPALAQHLAAQFPELDGRALAVSEVEPFSDKTNIPTLPIAVVALVGETGANGKGGGTQTVIEDDIMVHFSFEPVKYSLQDGADSPFFAFYDYETLRDRLLLSLRGWRTPRNGTLNFVSLEVNADEFAVHIAFRLRSETRLCIGDDETVPFTIGVRTFQPKGRCEDPCPETTTDPCDIPAVHLSNSGTTP